MIPLLRLTTTLIAGTYLTPSTRLLETTTVSAFAIGQPFLSVVAKNPTFLVVHHTQGLWIPALALAVMVGPPLVLWAGTTILGLFTQTLSQRVHTVLIGTMLGLAIAAPLNRLARVDGFAALFVLAALAASGIYLYVRAAWLTALIGYVALAPGIFVAVFVMTGPGWTLLTVPEPEPLRISLENQPPVVWVIFDQLPLGLLLDPTGGLDDSRFPNFARLAKSSTWYPNAITVSPVTHLAVPSALTGRYATPRKPPIAVEYPTNLFTLLGAHYQVSAFETVTKLCPPSICQSDPRDSLPLHFVITDSLVVMGRLLLSDTLADTFLPETNDAWGGFGDSDQSRSLEPVRSRGDDRARFSSFLEGIHANTESTLKYFHQEKPHEPLLMTPDGKAYDWCACFSTRKDGTWPDDPHMMLQRLQRYVMQTMFVDRELGMLLDQLELDRAFDDTLLIVMSDHGSAMLPGMANRQVGQGSSSEILPIPLFIKYPGQTIGAIDRRPATSLDVLPTLMSVLDASTSELAFEGSSLLRQPATDVRTETRYMDDEGSHVLPYPLEPSSALPQLIDRLMPAPKNPFVFGDHGYLVGARVQRHATSELDATIANGASFEEVDLNTGSVPAHVIGRLSGTSRPTQLAVALNGRVAGTGYSYLNGSQWQISLMADPAFLQEGRNEVQLFEIQAAGLAELDISDE